MNADLSQHIQHIKIADTHEHLRSESQWIADGPDDVLADLFNHYELSDLITAGAPSQLVYTDLVTQNNLDIQARFQAIRKAWEAVRFTGYGEAVRIHAKYIYGIEEITVKSLCDAQTKLDALRKPGQYLRLLRELAQLDHVQINHQGWRYEVNATAPEFFLHDLSWWNFSSGEIDPDLLEKETDVRITSLDTLRQSMEVLLSKYGPCAIAMKSQHAYSRSLVWFDRDDRQAELALQLVLRNKGKVDEETRCCLGDWCLARGCELAEKYGLPFKIHTGYLTGNQLMVPEKTRASHLCPLLMKYPKTRFVLMHISYPYCNELIAIAKHFHNVWVDMCWAWSLDPHAAMRFLRQFIHAVPINKLFAFGGDTKWPTGVCRYAIQMRYWLTRTLQAEVDSGYLNVTDAIAIANRILYENQLQCFDVIGVRKRIKERNKT